MSTPRWAALLLRLLAPSENRSEVLGDLDEAHARRRGRRGAIAAYLLTSFEALDMARALVLQRLRVPPVSALDFKLGLRMLVRYPALTVVGGVAIAFAVASGAGTFHFLDQMVHPTLPLDEGDRIVLVHNHDTETGQRGFPYAFDYALYRQELRTLRELGAFRDFERNLITGDGRSEPIRLAEVTAETFTVPRVAPLMGRGIQPGDLETGAPDVAVLGHDLWQTRFEGDPEIVGRTIRIATRNYEVVGVMPEGFQFPIAHSLWTPFRLGATTLEPNLGGPFVVFGRLAPGVELSEAQAEIEAVGRRLAESYPATHGRLQPRVRSFASVRWEFSGVQALVVQSINLVLVLFLVLVCSNVALLMFARAATREREVVVRSALGASRGRIVTQLLAEALVLAGAGAAVGLLAANRLLQWALGKIDAELFSGRTPFWITDSLGPKAVVYALLLVGLGAVLMGVVPALKLTAGGLETRLRQGAQGRPLRFGGVWTAIIVAQVAATVTFPVATFFVYRDIRQIESKSVPFDPAEILAARVQLDRVYDPVTGEREPTQDFLDRYTEIYRELAERLQAEGASAVSFAERLPLQYHPHRRIEIDEGGAGPETTGFGYRVTSARVDPALLETLGTEVVSGRGLGSGDVGADPGPVLVSEHFAEYVLGGRNPVGRRLRYLYLEEEGETTLEGPDAEPWYEIVGVMPNLGTSTEGERKLATIYHAATPATAHPVQIAVRPGGSAADFAPRLRDIAASMDPTLRLYEVMPLSLANQDGLEFYSFWSNSMLVVCSIAVILSLVGIYSVMSFTVAKRTREIGVRVALGSSRRRIFLGVFRRPLLQVVTGVAVGSLVGGWLVWQILRDDPWPAVAAIPLYALFMIGVCLLACIVPTKRALAIQPAEALRGE